MSTNSHDLSVLRELEGLSLGDRRLNERTRRVLQRMCERPDASLPQAMRTEAELEGAYRLLNNERVNADNLLAPHINATWERASTSDWVLSVEDTTELRFGGEKSRDGLGTLMNDGHGFYMHAALVVQPRGSVFVPVGVGGVELLVRDPNRPKVPPKQVYKDPSRESLRWARVSEMVADRAEATGTKVIHVCDREADDYYWLGEVLGRGGHFVVRTSVDRRTGRRTRDAATQTYLSGEIEMAAPIVARRDVRFQARTKSGGRRRRDPRAQRTTQLEVRSASVRLTRPDKTESKHKHLDMNLVWVVEPHPPEGESAIDWRLLTTEPVETAEQVLAVVDAYRARWLVEELFKALKTGCQFERLQLESFHALGNALALNLPLAWRMLRLRSIARDEPDQPASVAMDSEYLSALHFAAKKKRNPWGVKLPREPTAGDCLLAVARMGGHLKRNGAPGWLTIARGFETLHQLVILRQMMAEEM